MARCQINENIVLVFKPNKNTSFATIRQVDEELGRLEKIGIIQNVDHSKRQYQLGV